MMRGYKLVASSRVLLFSVLVAAILGGGDVVAEQQKERLVVVGTRALPRTVVDSNVPIDIVSRTEIDRSGITDTARILDSLIPSFHFSVPTISDGTDSVRPATLRGLYPDQVLVLINGKRRHNSALVHVNGTVGRGSAGVDFNAIPSSAIERIEVLREGAAAQYGSDAIAGVINIVLRQEAEETELSSYFGKYYEGDGFRQQHSLNTGLTLRESGFFHLTAEIHDSNRTNRALPDPRQQYPLVNGQPDPREATFNRVNHHFGDPDKRDKYLFFNTEVPLREDLQFYAFGGASNRDTDGAGFFRRALDDRNNPNIHPDGFLPRIVTDIDDTSLALGLRGDYSAWDWDASFVYGKNDFAFHVRNSVNVSLGNQSPTSAHSGDLIFEQKTVNLDLDRHFDVGWYSPVHVAVGFEYREDEYEIKAGEPASYQNGGALNQSGMPGVPGIQVFPGFTPENAVQETRQSRAVYFDLETQLAEKWHLGLATRYENYSDFGTDLSGKITTRYDWSPDFATRGTLATGFRAPSLMQQYFNSLSTQAVDVNGVEALTEVITARSDSDVVRQLGGEPLEEETSWSASFGFVWLLPQQWTITADAYYIEIDDRILLSSQYASSLSPEIAAILNPLGIGRIQFFANAVDTRTQGLDITVGWRHAFDHGGTLRVDALANFTSTEISGRKETPAILASTGRPLINFREQTWLEDGQPGRSYIINNYYRYEDHEINWRIRHYGSLRSAESDSPSTSQTFNSRWITDLEYGYHLTPNLRLSIGANNLFDTYPERAKIPSATNNGIFPYSRRVSQYGINGGFYYTSLKLSF